MKVSLTPSEVSLEEGEPFELNCETYKKDSSTDQFTYTWYKNDVLIDIQQSSATFTVDGDAFYRCIVEHDRMLFGRSDPTMVKVGKSILYKKKGIYFYPLHIIKKCINQVIKFLFTINKLLF